MRHGVERPSEQWDAQDASRRECPQIVKQQGVGQQTADRIDWHSDDLIQRGTVLPPPTTARGKT